MLGLTEDAVEDKVLFDSLKIAYEAELFSAEISQENLTEEKLPEWAEGDKEKVKTYYALHSESFLDKLLRTYGCKLGIIVHGNIN